jgi:hypothetical protein
MDGVFFDALQDESIRRLELELIATRDELELLRSQQRSDNHQQLEQLHTEAQNNNDKKVDRDWHVAADARSAVQLQFERYAERVASLEAECEQLRIDFGDVNERWRVTSERLGAANRNVDELRARLKTSLEHEQRAAIVRNDAIAALIDVCTTTATTLTAHASTPSSSLRGAANYVDDDSLQARIEHLIGASSQLRRSLLTLTSLDNDPRHQQTTGAVVPRQHNLNDETSQQAKPSIEQYVASSAAVSADIGVVVARLAELLRSCDERMAAVTRECRAQATRAESAERRVEATGAQLNESRATCDSLRRLVDESNETMTAALERVDESEAALASERAALAAATRERDEQTQLARQASERAAAVERRSDEQRRTLEAACDERVRVHVQQLADGAVQAAREALAAELEQQRAAANVALEQQRAAHDAVLRQRAADAEREATQLVSELERRVAAAEAGSAAQRQRADAAHAQQLEQRRVAALAELEQLRHQCDLAVAQLRAAADADALSIRDAAVRCRLSFVVSLC